MSPGHRSPLRRGPSILVRRTAPRGGAKAQPLQGIEDKDKRAGSNASFRHTSTAPGLWAIRDPDINILYPETREARIYLRKRCAKGLRK